MKTLTSITKQEFQVTVNYSDKTFTIVSNGTTYRTIELDEEEFNSNLKNTGNDWVQFMKSNDYCVVK